MMGSMFSCSSNTGKERVRSRTPQTSQLIQTNTERVAEETIQEAGRDVDSDIYSSASCVLQNLKSRLKKGTIINFDELIGYYGWEHHEYKALTEFLADTDFKIEYLAYGTTYVCCKLV